MAFANKITSGSPLLILQVKIEHTESTIVAIDPNLLAQIYPLSPGFTISFCVHLSVL